MFICSSDECFWLGYDVIVSLFAWFLTITCLTSMRHIQKNAKSLQSEGILSNTGMMRLYTILWIGVAIGYSCSIPVFIHRLKETKGTDREGQVSNAEYVITTFNNILSWGLEFAILATYYQFSNRMEDQLTTRMTKQLKQKFQASLPNRERFLSDFEEQERESALRRHEAYKEFADAQIQEVLKTMLSISKHSGDQLKFGNNPVSSSLQSININEESPNCIYEQTEEDVDLDIVSQRHDSEILFQEAMKKSVMKTISDMEVSRDTDNSANFSDLKQP